MKRINIASAASALIAFSAPALAETTLCTSIASVPMTISAPGVYCLKQDLQTSITTGNAITINANSVTIDFNGYRLGGFGAGPATQANGIFVEERKNITLRNANIRGYRVGIYINGSDGGPSSGHLVENSLVDGSTYIGIFASGTAVSIRNNRVVNTGPPPDYIATFGIYGAFLGESVIEDNVVSDTESSQAAFGIYQFDARDLKISRNTVAGVKSPNSLSAGIQIMNASRITVLDNDVISVHGPSAATGIASLYVSGSSIENNRINTLRGGATIGIRNDGDIRAACINNTIVDAYFATTGCGWQEGTVFAQTPPPP